MSGNNGRAISMFITILILATIFGIAVSRHLAQVRQSTYDLGPQPIGVHGVLTVRTNYMSIHGYNRWQKHIRTGSW
jgi:hypothetical protein